MLQMMQLAALVFVGVVEGLASEPRRGLTFSKENRKVFKKIFSISNTAEASKCRPIDSFYTFFFLMLVLKHDFKDTLTCKYRQMFTAMLNEN